MPQPRRYPNAAERQRAYRARQAAARVRELQAKGIPAAAPVPTMPSSRRWHELLQQARNLILTAHGEINAYWESRSTTWQETERAEAMSEHIEALDELAGRVEEIAGAYAAQGGHHA